MNEHIAPSGPIVGDTLTCAETGKAFTVVDEGCTFNYARNRQGDYFSNEGACIREVRALLDRSGPTFGYLSRQTFTDWKGNRLGDVVRHSTARNGFNGSTLHYVRVRDVHGALWYGAGAGEGMCITLRPMKG